MTHFPTLSLASLSGSAYSFRYASSMSLKKFAKPLGSPLGQGNNIQWLEAAIRTMRLAAERAAALRRGCHTAKNNSNKNWTPLSLLSPFATQPPCYLSCSTLTLPGDLLLFLKMLPNFTIPEGWLLWQNNPFLFLLPKHLEPIFTVEVQCCLFWYVDRFFCPMRLRNPWRH